MIYCLSFPLAHAGICVADTLEVEVVKEVFVNVHLPYSVVRGEQIELKATIYNYRPLRAKVSEQLNKFIYFFN